MAALALLRLFIIAVLIYVAFYLIWGRKKGKRLEEGNREQGPVNDVLKEDPVCRKLVPKKQAVRLRQNGETVYFCSEECCEKYEKKQEKSSD